MAVTMKTEVVWGVKQCGSCKNDVSVECTAFIIRVTRIGELRTTLAVTRNRITLQRNARRFLQESHCVTSQKTTFFNSWSLAGLSTACLNNWKTEWASGR
jgi:hypothetical protein